MQEILQEMANDTLLNLMFMDEKRFDIQQVVHQHNHRIWTSPSFIEGRIVTRRLNLQSVMVWAVVTETGRSPLLFVPSEAKLNLQCCISDILKGCLLPWAKKFPGACNKTLHLLTVRRSPSPGFRGKYPYS